MGSTPLTLKKLLDYPIMMLSPHSTTSEYLNRVFSSRGVNLSPEIELNSNDLLLDLARIGLGIACVPDYMVQNTPLVCVPLEEELPPRQIVLVTQTGLPLSEAARTFIDYFDPVKK